MCQVFEFTGRSPIPDTARVPSLTHGWDPGIFWPRFFLEVFASAVTRSWESLFFKAASDLFFLLFQVSLQQLHCQANYLLKANCATTKSTFCVMPPGFFFVTCILTNQFLGTLVTSQAMHAEDLWRKSFGLSFGRLFQRVWHFCCLGSNAASWQPDW